MSPREMEIHQAHGSGIDPTPGPQNTLSKSTGTAKFQLSQPPRHVRRILRRNFEFPQRLDSDSRRASGAGSLSMIHPDPRESRSSAAGGAVDPRPACGPDAHRRRPWESAGIRGFSTGSPGFLRGFSGTLPADPPAAEIVTPPRSAAPRRDRPRLGSGVDICPAPRRAPRPRGGRRTRQRPAAMLAERSRTQNAAERERSRTRTRPAERRTQLHAGF
eukprot:gene12969-biopygen70